MRLSPREIAIIAIGTAMLVVTGLWLWVFEPLRTHLDTLDRGLAYNQDRYRQVLTLSKTYARLKQRIATTEGRLKRHGDFSILSYLEAEADRMGVKKHIIQMKPKPGVTTRFYKENQVEIRMEKVTLPLLQRYLFQIENAQELMRIRELRIRPRFDNPNYLDVRFQVSSYEILEAVR
jgi:hypothetical protein